MLCTDCSRWVAQEVASGFVMPEGLGGPAGHPCWSHCYTGHPACSCPCCPYRGWRQSHGRCTRTQESYVRSGQEVGWMKRSGPVAPSIKEDGVVLGFLGFAVEPDFLKLRWIQPELPAEAEDRIVGLGQQVLVSQACGRCGSICLVAWAVKADFLEEIWIGRPPIPGSRPLDREWFLFCC